MKPLEMMEISCQLRRWQPQTGDLNSLECHHNRRTVWMSSYSIFRSGLSTFDMLQALGGSQGEMV